MKPLAERVCVVTGASRGIGRGVAQELGAAGATVYV
ncbi:MAG: SDR family NAD(P)-dependent oxidoreductase, partial [Myxococcota bacterium]